MVSIMAKIERTYNPDAVLFGNTNKGMNYPFTPTLNSLLNLPFAFPVPFNHLTCGIRLKIPVAGVHEHVCLGVPIPIMGGT